MRDVIDRQRTFVPAWRGNQDNPAEAQIRVTFRLPGFLELATLTRPSVAVVTTLMVLTREEINGQVILMTDLSRVVTDVLRTATWAKVQKVDQAEVPSTEELLNQTVEFVGSYLKALVTKVESLPEISTGADLANAPTVMAGLLFEVALEIWNSHSLTEEKKTA